MSIERNDLFETSDVHEKMGEITQAQEELKISIASELLVLHDTIDESRDRADFAEILLEPDIYIQDDKVDEKFLEGDFDFVPSQDHHQFA